MFTGIKTRAVPTVIGVEGDQDARAVPIWALLPDFGLIPLGTEHLLSLPIYGEAVAMVGPLCPGLPAVVHPTRPDQTNTELLPAADEHFGVDVGRVDQMLLGSGRS